MTEKLQKVLARAGLGSRRELEKWIAQGRVKVNRKLAVLGDRVAATDKILVDDKPVFIKSEKPKRKVLLYHKPVGEVCTRSDPEGRPTVFAKLPLLRGSRWIAIGRLDINTQGLLLFTNDGEFAHQLLHPSFEIEREYAVRVLGEVTPLMLNRLKSGVELTDGLASFYDIKDAGGEGANHWYHVILKEGRNRETRRLWESQGVKVSRLMRVRFGPVLLPRYLRPGKWEELDAKSADRLAEQLKNKQLRK